MPELTMPRLSDTMSEGAISRWLKKPGDSVEVGEVVAEIETDKATMDLESFDKGFLQEIRVPEGKTVPIGTVIGVIGKTATAPAGQPAAAAPVPAAPAAAAPPAQETAPAAAPSQAAAPAAPTTAPAGDRPIKASPVARKMAQALGVALEEVQGTGPGGRIIKENIESHVAQREAAAQASGVASPAPSVPVQAPQAPQAPAPVAARSAEATTAAAVPMNGMRRAIAQAMTASKPGVPHIYVTIEIDMGAALALRKQINEGNPKLKISVNDLVIKAAASALTSFPALNSSFTLLDGNTPAIITHEQINVGVAVATDKGLLAPVVRDVDKKSLGTISSEVRELATRAREGKAKQGDLEGATFQISNMGMMDIVAFTSIISVPQAASLAVGAVRQVPVVRDGQIVIGEMMYVTLSVDHRVADGGTAAQYLQLLRDVLQSPLNLLV